MLRHRADEPESAVILKGHWLILFLEESGVVIIGRMLLLEFTDGDTGAFDEIVKVLERYPDFRKMKIELDRSITMPGLEINTLSRRIYCGGKEVHLTAKEYSLLCLFVINQGYVLTYEQIYERVWNDCGEVDNNVIRYHVYNLRDKLYMTYPDAPFSIRCVREVGYCMELKCGK